MTGPSPITPVLGENRIILPNMTFKITTAAGVMSLFDANSVEFEWDIKEELATGGGSLVEQVSLTRYNARGTVKGWMSNILSAMDIRPAKKIAGIEFEDDEETPVDFLTAWDDFVTMFPPTGWTFGKTNFKFDNSKPSDWETKIICSVISGGVD